MSTKSATSSQAPSVEMVAMNEALRLGVLRQHELTEATENLSALLVFENIEHKLAEDILRRNKALVSSLIEMAPMGVYVVDATFHLLRCSLNARPFFHKIEPLIGRDFSEITHILWRKRVADKMTARFRHTLTSGESYQTSEFAERRRDIGVKEIYDWQIHRVTLPSRDFGVVCFFSNITERKNEENARRRLEVLTASNLKLQKEILRRKAVTKELQRTQREQAISLDLSRAQEEQLRDLSRRILHVQEEERKRISRELHDVITQNLVSINVHVSALAKACAATSGSLQQEIDGTQQLVEHTVNMVHQFARELRPTVLDDLGLIPALHSILKGFMKDTGVRSSLATFAGIEQVDGDMRTVLFRVAQEALSNVARHAEADHVAVNIRTHKRIIRMEIKDDGRGFVADSQASSGKARRLGLLGMKERVEMVGGKFLVESSPGQGTTVSVEIPRPRRQKTAFPSPP